MQAFVDKTFVKVLVGHKVLFDPLHAIWLYQLRNISACSNPIQCFSYRTIDEEIVHKKDLHKIIIVVKDFFLSCVAAVRRYVGDILAWLHQAVAGEKELLQSLLRRTNIKG